MLSIVLPSWKDPLLASTIADLLAQARGDIEVIAVLDGYDPWFPLPDDPRVRLIRLPQNRGMREAINAGVDAARGAWIMRADEHQRFGEGYDVILTAACGPEAIITPRRYALDPQRWAVMEDIPPVDDMKLKIVNYDRGQKFSGVAWQRDGLPAVHETMAMQGSCWLMSRAWWDRVIGRLQTEGYGTHYQDSHEMVFKTWQAGGRLLTCRDTWHAHKHRKFPRTHSYGGALADACFAYALSVWRDYYEQEIRPRWGI